jgi:hypothetical protein
MCFCWVKRKSRLKPAKFFVALRRTRIKFIQRPSGLTLSEDMRPKTITRRTNGYIKSGGEQIAHRR